MAVTETKVTTALVLKLKTGQLNGKDVFKNLTFKRVKSEVVDGDIFAVAVGVAGILAYPVSSIYKQEVNELTNA
jgi:hypothetical protein